MRILYIILFIILFTSSCGSVSKTEMPNHLVVKTIDQVIQEESPFCWNKFLNVLVEPSLRGDSAEFIRLYTNNTYLSDDQKKACIEHYKGILRRYVKKTEDKEK